MASADALAILAQAPYVFYGGENCMSIGTYHTIISMVCKAPTVVQFSPALKSHGAWAIIV